MPTRIADAARSEGDRLDLDGHLRCWSPRFDARDMPSLLVHSLHQQPWDPAQGGDFAGPSRAKGVSVELVVLPGRLHGIEGWRTIWPTLRSWLLERLERLGRTDRRSR